MTHVLNQLVHPKSTHRSAGRLVRRRLLVLLWTLLFLVHSANLSQVVHAATAGIPFDEPFDENNLQDPLLTNANWSTEEEALFLAWRKARFGTFGPESVGSNISNDGHDTYAVALGDVDGDGDLDLVAGNLGEANRLYLNNGTCAPFNGVTGTDISADEDATNAVALGDVDGDGDLDLVAGNIGPNRLYLNNGTSNPFEGVSGSNISTDSHRTRAVALGDVDGDGDLDLVAGNIGPNRLYLNNGTSAPFAGVTGSNISNDSHSTWSVALGDVDGDGDLDLVAGNLGEANRLYLNNGTSDPFAGVTGSDISDDSHSTWSVALGNMDSDGDLDLVAGNSNSPNRLYLNNGTSDPFAGVTGSSISADDAITFAVALGDVDGDGDLDLVAGNNVGRNRLYLNNGTADPFADVTGTDIGTDSDLTTYAVALGDVDGDGDLDLVVGNYFGPNRLYLNNGTVDPFAGISGSDISTDSHQTWDVTVGDVDGDGDLDLVAGNDGQTNRLYLNNGTATPFEGVSGSDITDDIDSTRAVALGDVDNDGDLDLVTGNNGVNRLYLNNGTSDPFDDVEGTEISADGYNTLAVTLGDVDGDGDLDLVTGNNGVIRLYLNNGTADPFNDVIGSDISTDSYATQAVALGDVDGDGDLDLVAGNDGQRNRLYLNNGTSNPFNNLAGIDISTDEHNTLAVALGDVDGDGDLDLVAGNRNQPNRLYLNNGTAAPFAGVTGGDIATDSDSTRDVALGDVDEDGDLDLVVGNIFAPNRLYLNNGTSDPFNGVTGSDITADNKVTSAVALGDMDGDGDLDLVAGNFDRPNRLYLNNGMSNPFNGVSGSDISTDSHRTRAVALGDVDGDGDLDLVAGNFFGPNRLYLNNGTSDPFSGITGSDITGDDHSTAAVALGDVDGDSDLDLVVGNEFGPNRLYLNNGTADPFAGVTGTDIATGGSTEAVALGDVDSDGDLDLVVGNFFGPNRLYLNNGTSDPFNGVTGSDISTDDYITFAVALGDVDGDGDLDLVAGNDDMLNQLDGAPGTSIGTGVNRLYLNNGTSDPFAGVTGIGISTDSDQTFAVALGDVDGDGDLDLVAGNFIGRNRLYLNNGTADPFAGVTGSNIGDDDPATEAVALGDVDSDGDLDLVVGNFFGPNRLYLNNGTSDPFAGVTGSDITGDSHATFAVALGDVDGNGDLDLVAGNQNHRNRLYVRRIYDTSRGRAGSLRIDAESENVRAARIVPAQSLPVNTQVTYWLSNNGGLTWYLAQPGRYFPFPTSGSDLRWRAELASLSPVLTPRIDALQIDINRPPAADAGDDQSVSVGSVVTLDGSASSDLEGDLPLAFAWEQTDGPAVSFTKDMTTTTFTAPATPTVLTFTLTVTDSFGLVSTPDSTVVTVTDTPITDLSAGNDSPTELGSSTSFTATATGSNIVYTWDFGDGNTGNGATPSHTYAAAGIYTATVTASNGTDTQLATTQVTINAVVNFLPPSPLNDAAATLETQAVAGNVLANDTDPQASPLTVSAFTQPAHGSVTLADNGDYTYTPAADFTGVDSFSYTVSNSHQLTATAHVFIVVKPLAASEGPPQQLVSTPGISTTHTISDGGFQITVEVPAVNDSGTQQAQVVLYTPLPTTTVDVDAAPGAFQFGGLLFSLEFYVNGELQQGYQFPSPLLLTITYPEDALAGLVAEEATLLYWNGTAWASDGIEMVAHDMALRTITFTISHLTEFGLFAVQELTNEDQIPQQHIPVELFMPALSR